MSARELVAPCLRRGLEKDELRLSHDGFRGGFWGVAPLPRYQHQVLGGHELGFRRAPLWGAEQLQGQRQHVAQRRVRTCRPSLPELARPLADPAVGGIVVEVLGPDLLHPVQHDVQAGSLVGQLGCLGNLLPQSPRLFQSSAGHLDRRPLPVDLPRHLTDRLPQQAPVSDVGLPNGGGQLAQARSSQPEESHFIPDRVSDAIQEEPSDCLAFAGRTRLLDPQFLIIG